MAAMKAPQGTVWLGHVPWDSSYRHVWYEGMLDKQVLLNQFMTLHTDDYSYIRQDTNIRVPYNADDLYGINYCMYMNGDMWFCAFVNTITFLNNETSTLHLQEDIWHTWGDRLSYHPCLVAREHVSTDNYGQWRAPEPSMALEEVSLVTHEFTDTFDLLVIGTNAIPHLKNGVSGTVFTSHAETDFDGSEAVAGGMYSSIFSGAKYYGFSIEGAGAAVNFLDNLNKSGAAESVCAMFMVPSMLFSVNAAHEVSPRNKYESFFNAPRTMGNGYIPRNKKCFTFPYAFASLTDFNGAEMQIKYEDCNTWGKVMYRLEEGLDPTANVQLTMLEHMGLAVDLSHTMTLSKNPQCAWVYEAFLNWMAQNASTQQVKQNMNLIDIAIGLGMTGVGAFLVATGAGAPAGGVLGTLGLSTVEAAGLTLAASGVGKGAAGMRAEVERGAQIDSQKKVPNRLSGTSTSNSLQGIGRNEGGYICYGLQEQSARRLDAFFDVFGYAVDTVKAPNLIGRKSWNYVKTVGANMDGDVPSDRLTAMNQRLDEGMTFWHNPDVGNYSLDNTLGE